MTYSKKKKGGGGLHPPSPTPKPLAAKFTSQGDARLRTDAQIKFLYFALVRVTPLACTLCGRSQACTKFVKACIQWGSALAFQIFIESIIFKYSVVKTGLLKC